LFGRGVDGVPPCSAAEFAGLAAWLAMNGDALPTVGWQKSLDVGGVPEVTLASLRWQVGRGVGADGSGKAAETIRRLRARHGDGRLEHVGNDGDHRGVAALAVAEPFGVSRRPGA
jgi:hypothetical protein